MLQKLTVFLLLFIVNYSLTAKELEEQLNDLYPKEIPSKKEYKFLLLPHYQNYLLLAGYSPNTLTQKHWNQEGERDYKKDYTRDTNEAQFQISLKMPLYKDILNSDATLFFAYTQTSFWQVYNQNRSRPFRETNYMPELFLEWNPDTTIGATKLEKVRLSLIHQSNGKEIGASRSWNRTQLHFTFKENNFSYGADVWHRWYEKKKDSTSDPKGDDNPNLEKYIGKQKYFIKYKTDNYKVVLSHQNDIFDYATSKGNTKLDLVFPSTHKKIDFFIRYFNGYGESLIDYDVKVVRVSFGIILADWE